MSDPAVYKRGSTDLESVIATDELLSRPVRGDRPSGLASALVMLNEEIARDPNAFFQTLVDTALALTGADSTGVSLLNSQRTRFVWPAVAGGLKRHTWEGTPRDFGPCGVVLDRNRALLMQHPERHFSYLEPIDPPMQELLLIPFYLDNRAVGTLWAALHNSERKFDAEDRRLLENLAAFASAAYRSLIKATTLPSILSSGAA